MFNIIAILIYVLFTSGGLIAVKMASTASQHMVHVGDKISFPFNLWLLFGVGLYGLSFVIYIFLISRFELGYIIPLTTGLVYIIIFFASFALFKEPFTIVKTLAIALIIAGTILINLKK